MNNFLEQSAEICKSFFNLSSGQFDCNFTLYTDGISIFEKSNLSIWPIYMVFNDIPYSFRYKLENIAIVGIYFGNVKPNMQILFQKAFTPYLSYLNNFYSYKNISFRYIFKYLVCDKPAKSMCLNFQSHNASFFCPLCTATSKVEFIENIRHCYIPLSVMFNSERRTHSGFLALAYSAECTKLPDYGVKGLCFLANINTFDAISSNVIDYMHSICLGVIKRSIELILKKADVRSKFLKLKDFVNLIKIPSFVPVHCIDLLCMAKWKAKDFRFFLFYISPLLKDVDLHSYHLMFNSLRKGLIVLFNSPISSNDSNISQLCFKRFLLTFSNLFGKHNITSNFHDLVHLPSIALTTGPLYEFSSFNFEHLNGRLRKLCKGNKRLDKQILFKIQIFFQSLKPNDICDQNLVNFINDIKPNKVWKRTLSIDLNSYLCGKGKCSSLDSEKSSLISSHLSTVNHVNQYSRAVINFQKISTVSYDSNKKKSHSIFISKDKKLCVKVLDILSMTGDENQLFYFAFCQKYVLKSLYFNVFSTDNSNQRLFIRLTDFFSFYEPAISFKNYIFPIINNEKF